MASDFTDERGTIHDLITGDLSSATEIFTVAGAVRGNHYHKLTTQWVYVVSGDMLVACDTLVAGIDQRVYHPGDFFEEQKGLPHAWKAMTDCRVIVITRGPRAGENFEDDTYRDLQFPLLT